MSRNVMSRTPTPVTRRNSTSTSVHRARLPRKPQIIPEERRHVLEAPCDLCGNVRWVAFGTGLTGDEVCTRCRGIQKDAR